MKSLALWPGAPITLLLHEARARPGALVSELLAILPDPSTPAQDPDASRYSFVNRPAALDDAVAAAPSHAHGAATRPDRGFLCASVPSGFEHSGLPGQESRKAVERASVGHVPRARRFDQPALPLPVHLVLHPPVHLIQVSRKQRMPECSRILRAMVQRQEQTEEEQGSHSSIHARQSDTARCNAASLRRSPRRSSFARV